MSNVAVRRRYRRAESAIVNRITLRLVKDHKSGILVASQATDYGPSERANHLHGIQIVDRSVARGGIVTGHGAIAIGENYMDRLRLHGLLGEKDELRLRGLAIEWVRKVFHKAGLWERTTAAYQPRTSRTSGEISDGQAVAFDLYMLMWAELGASKSAMIETAVCFDIELPREKIPFLCKALDHLAKWRNL